MIPTTTGFYLFSGSRIAYNNQCKRLHEPVAVVEVWQSGGYELAVKLIGRQQAFPLRMFSGEWERLEVAP